jgi:non-ribosomal peptide synthetase component F
MEATILNNTHVDYPKEKALFDLFNEAAQAYPDKIAISFHDRSLTYTEVANTANRIAALLVQKGIKKGDIIGLALDRTPEMIISLLAIMKSGAAYVPLDPNTQKTV